MSDVQRTSCKLMPASYTSTMLSIHVKDAVDRYWEDVERVAKELLANLSILMSVEKDGLLGLHGKMKQA